jgi:dTDP-4-amino-4,6-dideoxygalactose transaminase
VGFNYAMSNVSAAIGVAQMEQLPAFIDTKRRNRTRYAERLRDVPGLTFLEAPGGTSSNCWFYSVLIEPAEFGMDRNELMAGLAEHGIQTRPLWLPIHLQKPYVACRAVGVERAVWYWERLLNLPCSSSMREQDVDRVVDAIRSLARS